MKHTKILNSHQKILGVYISDLFPLSLIWFLCARLVPESLKGFELLLLLLFYGVAFYLRSKFRKGFLVDYLVNQYVRVFLGGVYVHKYKNNWNVLEEMGQ